MKKVWVKTADGTEFGQIEFDELLHLVADLSVDFDLDRNVATVYCSPDVLEDADQRSSIFPKL